jgi:ParB family chromosome partitioning protein
VAESWEGIGGGPARGIGRGLADILVRNERNEQPLREIAVDLIQPNPRQPRRHFDDQALLALSESIRARGVLQPIVVRPMVGATYELVAGERRLRASRMAELEKVPCIVRETPEGERLEIALIENMAREDLNPVEEARACATLVEDLGVTKEELGRRIGRSRVAVSNLIRLLDLPEVALAAIEHGDLTEGHGRAILMCREEAGRRRLAKDAEEHGWSVRETERRAKAADGKPDAPARRTVTIHPDLADALGAAEDALSAALGRDVKVRTRGDRFVAEFELADPREGVEMAERVLRRPVD